MKSDRALLVLKGRSLTRALHSGPQCRFGRAQRGTHSYGRARTQPALTPRARSQCALFTAVFRTAAVQPYCIFF